MPAAALEFCSANLQMNCVVDGDTVRLEGMKIRLLDIDAAEPGARCYAERILAARAAARLAELLGPAMMSSSGAASIATGAT